MGDDETRHGVSLRIQLRPSCASIGKVGDLGLTFVSTFELKVSDEVTNNDGKKIQKVKKRFKNQESSDTRVKIVSKID